MENKPCKIDGGTYGWNEVKIMVGATPIECTTSKHYTSSITFYKSEIDALLNAENIEVKPNRRSRRKNNDVK